ncbi:unnamed protein product [Linum tenue]|uniref:Secreted protein n=1 Tax=Linum tenue TaxID=586396 RepID=A0AAV0GZA0_9ROSI|nr:unnamed protein product [Linum tenue]
MMMRWWWRRCCGVAAWVGSRSWRLTRMAHGRQLEHRMPTSSGKGWWGIGRTI